LRYGGKVLGICGGFQMLGGMIHDPGGLEGGTGPGLGFLDMQTTLQEQKQLRNAQGSLLLERNELCKVTGYEIHSGKSSGPALQKPLLELEDAAGRKRTDGAVSHDNQIAGTYLHGIFESPAACASLLKWAGLNAAAAMDYKAIREQNLELLAGLVEEHLNTEKLAELFQT
jgi:adenosylcobyric acid synthase